MYARISSLIIDSMTIQTVVAGNLFFSFYMQWSDNRFLPVLTKNGSPSLNGFKKIKEMGKND